MLTKILLSCAMLFTMIAQQNVGWRGIVPLRSTRADVERLIGKPNFKYDLYDFENERVDILYSRDPCSAGSHVSWDVPPGTVIGISIVPQNDLRFSDLKLDLSKFNRTEHAPVREHSVYRSEEEGVSYVVYEGSGKNNGMVMRIYYGPAAKDSYLLRCREIKNKRNNTSGARRAPAPQRGAQRSEWCERQRAHERSEAQGGRVCGCGAFR